VTCSMTHHNRAMRTLESTATLCQGVTGTLRDTTGSKLRLLIGTLPACAACDVSSRVSVACRRRLAASKETPAHQRDSPTSALGPVNICAGTRPLRRRHQSSASPEVKAMPSTTCCNTAHRLLVSNARMPLICDMTGRGHLFALLRTRGTCMLYVVCCTWPCSGGLGQRARFKATSSPSLASSNACTHGTSHICAYWDWAHPCHICAGTGLTPATSAPIKTARTLATSPRGLGSPLPHLHGDWAHPCHICTGTGLTLHRFFECLHSRRRLCYAHTPRAHATPRLAYL
jgi:hypothetical protein